MRWTVEYPKLGDTRTKSWFAWVPTWAGFPRREWRWLERVTAEQEYVNGKPAAFWVNRRFVGPMDAYLRAKEMFL